MHDRPSPWSPSTIFDRRRMLQGAAGAAAAGMVSWAGPGRAADPQAAAATPLKGNIKHSIVHWCFGQHWDVEKACQVARQLGCQSVELVGPEDWDTLKKYNLTCALVPAHLFVQGMNNPRYQPACLEMLTQSIDNAAQAGFPTVITFTGFAEETGEWADGGIPDLAKLPPEGRRVIDPEQGIKNCVAGFKKIVGYAEKKKINLSLEILNSRVSNHPMKGHPGYQGDHTDYCMEIIRQVGSPRLGLLFDIYHVQIMDGDLVTRIQQCGEAINHIHTAGNPGRGELDGSQEINYAPCMEALVKIGYDGYVGHEFIPTRDPLVGLSEAVRVCDV